MRLGIKSKQVLGVTAIVGAVVVALSVMHLAALARVRVADSQAQAEIFSKAILERAREAVAAGDDPVPALRADPGLRSILRSSLYATNVTFAAIVDQDGVAVAHADPALEGQPVRGGKELQTLLLRSPVPLLLALYGGEGRNLEVRQPLLLGDTEFGSIRIGVSTVLIWRDLYDSVVQPALVTALVALAVAVVGAMLLAQVLLRPIHVIRSGLTRLGQGEFGVRLDLDQGDEFGELGTFFNTASARLSADRTHLAGQMANLESAVERLEDALGLVSPDGEWLFVNPAMRALVPGAAVGTRLDDLLPPDHRLRQLADQTLASRQPRGPMSAMFSGGGGDTGERLIVTSPVSDAAGALVGIMLVARNLGYLTQVQSTVRYSRKLAALGRLSAGVAHEVKNPLNSMMIHLELLRQQCRMDAPAAGEAASPDQIQALVHLDVIAGEIRRLDEVVQGFLKFTRPEDLTLQPISLVALIDEVLPVVRPEADRRGVALVIECAQAPDLNGDPGMLRQAFLNLALNACQAMPDGGTLTIRGERARNRQVAVTVSDTGVGIDPKHLGRIFDLYFTTRERGSGIGLSMVFRTVQMHDGEIEVQSTLGVGTTFRMLLPEA